MSETSQNIFTTIKKSRILQLILIGILVLVLKIPVFMISNLIREREAREHEAMTEVTSKWGSEQVLTGPVLVIPYKYHWREIGDKGKTIERIQTRFATFLPEKLNAQGEMKTELRYRGIFEVPVYHIALNVQGEFMRPSFQEWDVQPGDILWDQAQLTVGISDTRAVREQVKLNWNEQIFSFLPGIGAYESIAESGMHVNLAKQLNAQRFAFSFSLLLNGSQGLFVAPFGRDTTVALKSNWQSPSFQGAWLPNQRTINVNGFDASWSIPYLGRNYPQSWNSEKLMKDKIAASQFGVNLITAIDKYRMAERSVKYAGLFILLTFAAIWLIEILVKFRVHFLQYLLLGFALCVFYLLELSLSEHIRFAAAYAIAAIAVIVMTTAYGKVMLKTYTKAAIVGSVTTTLYGYLYVILCNEDYALLMGSIGLFVILGLVMFLTRRVNWSDTNA
ncbi:MAG: cell envelope integrity protein CreD [Desulfobacteraceae bacterium]|nr:MAG: cell envelope integrity protein CreD [Desulfobacteraceae bacterium]